MTPPINIIPPFPPIQMSTQPAAVVPPTVNGPPAVVATEAPVKKERKGPIGKYHDWLSTTCWVKPTNRRIERVVFCIALAVQILCSISTAWYLYWGWISIVLAIIAAIFGAHLAFVDKCAKNPKSGCAKGSSASFWAFWVTQIGWLGFQGYVLYCYIYAIAWGFNDLSLIGSNQWCTYMKGASNYFPLPAPNSAVCTEYASRWQSGAASAGVAVVGCLVSLMFASCLHITADDAIVRHAEEIRLKEVEAAYGKEAAAAVAAAPLPAPDSNVITVVLPPGMAPPKPGEAPPEWVTQAKVVNGVVAYQPPPTNVVTAPPIVNQTVVPPVTQTQIAAVPPATQPVAPQPGQKHTMFPFQARNNLELTVAAGQPITVLEPPSADGFTKVQLVQTGQVGLIPSNYISQ